MLGATYSQFPIMIREVREEVREALVVGINNHTFHKDLNLKAPVKDAEAIAQMLKKYGKFRVQRLPKDYDETGGERFIPDGKVQSEDLAHFGF